MFSKNAIETVSALTLGDPSNEGEAALFPIVEAQVKQILSGGENTMAFTMAATAASVVPRQNGGASFLYRIPIAPL